MQAIAHLCRLAICKCQICERKHAPRVTLLERVQRCLPTNRPGDSQSVQVSKHALVQSYQVFELEMRGGGGVLTLGPQEGGAGSMLLDYSLVVERGDFCWVESNWPLRSGIHGPDSWRAAHHGLNSTRPSLRAPGSQWWPA